MDYCCKFQIWKKKIPLALHTQKNIVLNFSFFFYSLPHTEVFILFLCPFLYSKKFFLTQFQTQEKNILLKKKNPKTLSSTTECLFFFSKKNDYFQHMEKKKKKKFPPDVKS